MKISKKHIIAGTIGIITISGALLYFQIMKLKDAAIKFSHLRIKKIAFPNFDLDMFLNITNDSNLTVTIKSQEYSIFVNDKFVSKIQNKAQSVVKSKSTSTVGVNVKFNVNEIYKALGQDPVSAILKGTETMVKIDMKIKASVLGIPVNMPIVIEKTLKELTT